jgi:hypothetical protein
MAALLAQHGFDVTADVDLVKTAETLGLPIRRRTSLAHSRVMIAEKRQQP